MTHFILATVFSLSLQLAAGATTTTPQEIEEAKAQYVKSVETMAEVESSIATRIVKICEAESRSQNRAASTLREQVRLLQVKLDTARFDANRIVAIHGSVITESVTKTVTNKGFTLSTERAWRGEHVRIARKLFVRDLRKLFHF